MAVFRYRWCCLRARKLRWPCCVASGVAKERERSIGRVVVAGVVFKGSHSNSCVIAAVVFNKSAAVPTAVLSFPLLRSSAASADSGVVAALCVGKERIPTKCRVCKAGGVAKKGMVPVRRVERVDTPWIWCRLHLWQKREAEEREYDEKWWSCFELNQWIHRCSFRSPGG